MIERLYGIIFGACSKRTEIDKEVFSQLAEVVYRTVFEQDIVYPDILLRDYARLIIELFLTENPSYEGCIDPDKIKPPYNSEPIPHIEDKKYLEKEYEGGMWWIVHSMCFEGRGMYGDFGRYIFQSALRHFEVDEREVFNYAIFFIVNELGYREDYFDKFDTHCNRYDRHQTAKVERIGKKYQWIAMHNILSRVADHCRMVDAWSYPSRESVCFEGAWDLYVRDFDPTLNKNFLICPNAPSFDAIRNHIISSKEDNKAVDLTNDDACDLWLEKSEPFFDGIKNLFIMTDNNRHEWISLTKFLDTGRDRLDEDKLYSWSWIYGYFVDSEILDAFSKAFERGDDLIEGGANSHHETYSVFNREYPWSPSCNSFDESAWITVSLPSEEKKTVIESYKMPDMDAYRVLLDEGHVSDVESINELSFLDGGENGGDKELSVPFKDVYYEREIKDNIGPILYSTSRLIWEGQYDATNESTVLWEVPCFEIVKTLDLKQMSYDGYFYDRDNRLAAFDTSLIQYVGGVVIRRDLLDEFLEKKRLNLIWIIQGEKSIHGSEWTIAKMSKWQGLYKYNAGGVSGDIRFQGLMP